MGHDTLLSIFDNVPTWVMVTPIIINSIIAVSTIVERLIFYRQISYDYQPIVSTVIGMLKESRFSEISAYCKNYSGPIMGMIENYSQERAHPELQSRGMLYYAEHTVKRIERFVALLSTVATTSPMFGLLGTVTGIMKSFSGLSKAGPTAHSLLAYGIAEALISTALGLLVAIPSVIFYNYMVSKIEFFTKEVEFVANSLQNG